MCWGLLEKNSSNFAKFDTWQQTRQKQNWSEKTYPFPIGQYTGYQYTGYCFCWQSMQKTNMAPLIQRLLFLGIILLLTNHYVKSSPARIPVKDVKDKETSDKSHTGNELKNSVDQSREDKAGKSWRFFIGSWNSFNVGLQNKVMLIVPVKAHARFNCLRCWRRSTTKTRGIAGRKRTD